VNPLRATAAIALLVIAALVLPSSLIALASGPGAAILAAPVAAPASEGPYITAIGVGIVMPTTADFVVTPQTLFVNAQSQAEAVAVDRAIDEMQARLTAIKSALETVGVPAAGIRFVALNLNPQFGVLKPGQPSPVEKGQPLPQQVASYTINGSLQADIPTVKLLIPAINAANANGATTVNAGGGKMGPQAPVQPPQADLEKGITQAIASARSTADAMATASGKKLGDIRSIASQQLFPTCCPPNNGWQVQVTVTFNIAP